MPELPPQLPKSLDARRRKLLFWKLRWTACEMLIVGTCLCLSLVWNLPGVGMPLLWLFVAIDAVVRFSHYMQAGVR
jgi:hypothetical protein